MHTFYMPVLYGNQSEFISHHQRGFLPRIFPGCKFLGFLFKFIAFRSKLNEAVFERGDLFSDLFPVRQVSSDKLLQFINIFLSGSGCMRLFFDNRFTPRIFSGGRPSVDVYAFGLPCIPVDVCPKVMGGICPNQQMSAQQP